MTIKIGKVLIASPPGSSSEFKLRMKDIGLNCLIIGLWWWYSNKRKEITNWAAMKEPVGPNENEFEIKTKENFIEVENK